MNSRILPLLALVVAVSIFFLYVSPTWNGPVATTKAAIASDNQTLTIANQYAAQENQLAAARNAIDPNKLALLNTFLPSSVDNVGMILDLDALAARSQLSLSSINVVTGTSANTLNTSAASGTVGSVDLSLSASGTLASLQTFLSGVEKSARLLDLQDLAVTGSDTGVYTYKMTIRLYWLQ